MALQKAILAQPHEACLGLLPACCNRMYPLFNHRQLRDVQAKVQDESHVSQTGAYLAMQRHAQVQGTELEKARKMLESLQRECEGYKHATQGLMQQVSESEERLPDSHKILKLIRDNLQVRLQLAWEYFYSSEARHFECTCCSILTMLGSFWDVMSTAIPTTYGNAHTTFWQQPRTEPRKIRVWTSKCFSVEIPSGCT